MTTTLSKSITYSVILLGCLLSFVSAFTTQYALGYYLDFGVVMTGLVPYLIFAMAVVLRQSMLSTIIGIALILVHAWMVFTERLVLTDRSDELLLYGPLVLAVVLLPLLAIAMRKPYSG